jgi:FAD dependent oxidoreductase TIGR03364
MMHAVVARERGCEVIQLEREADARGASVRNFGLIWVSGREPGPELDLALRSRARWEELAGRVPGLGFRAGGSVTVAADDAELRVLKEASALPDAGLRGYELLDPAQVRAANPALRGEYVGGLLCRRDAIVEPRQVPRAIREHLQADRAGRYRWLAGREAVEVTGGGVRDQTGEWHRGDLVILCTGAAYSGVVARHLASYPAPPVRRVRLQMMQTQPYSGRLATSVADGDSLRYYPAYELPARQHLRRQAPVAEQARAQLLLVQRLDGSLTIGDTHAYDEPFGFDVHEDAYDHLRARAEALLGGPIPPVHRRWAGVYSQVSPASAASAASDGLYHRSEVAPGVVLVTGPGGRGMTCAAAIAEETFG